MTGDTGDKGGESRYIRRARELRSEGCNCAQSVLIPFAEEAGMDAETAARLGANFGSGMRMGSVCGAITGGLMALGLLGLDDRTVTTRYLASLREAHDNVLDCAGLLRRAAQEGIARGPHCDAMVYECIGLVESLMRQS